MIQQRYTRHGRMDEPGKVKGPAPQCVLPGMAPDDDEWLALLRFRGTSYRMIEILTGVPRQTACDRVNAYRRPLPPASPFWQRVEF